MPQANKKDAKTKGVKNISSLLYHPSIFRYHCRGRLDLNSREPTAGVCKGFQSSLSHLDHWRLSTREEAIRVFQQKSGEPTERPTGTPDTNGAREAQKMELSENLISNVLVYPSHEDRSQNSSEGEDGKMEDWSCYGSTEVDLLVLRPQNSKKETIAAVSPYCAPGVTSREVASPALGREKTSTIRLGVVEIVYQSSVAEDEEEMQSHEVGKMASPQDKKKETTPPIPIRLWNSSTNILKHMKINSQLVYQATQENFPERTFSSGMRIVQEFDKTWNRTTALMKKVAFWSWDGDGGDNSK